MSAKAAAIPGVSGVLVTIPPDPSDSDAVAAVPTAVWGWSAFDASAAVFALYDGTSTSGVLLVTVELVAGQENIIELTDPLEVDSGAIYVNLVSGTPTGEIYWG
jgi:hypothetical protein